MAKEKFSSSWSSSIYEAGISEHSREARVRLLMLTLSSIRWRKAEISPSTIMSVGQKPVGDELYRGLLEKGIETLKIGDAVQQGNFRAATRAALEAAYRI